MSELDACLAEARALLGERLDTRASVRDHHAHGEDSHPPRAPDAVAFVETTEEAAAIARICHAHRVPMVPFGAGTSLEGHVTPVRGGVSIDLSHMTAILDVQPDDMDCRVQAGVTRDQLNTHCRDLGLFFPIDPGTGACTIGGMAATRASGTNAVRYGTMRDAVMGLTVVLADGRVVRTGGRIRKSSSGYDLTRLFVGSEGTLGIMTEVQLRLHPIPESVTAAACQFPSLADAVATVIDILHAAIPIARMELLDEVQTGACIAYSKLEGLAALPSLFLEFHGTPASTAEQAGLAEAIATDHGASGFAWAADPAARAKLWKARHDAYWAALAMRPGWKAFTTDAIVPVSRLSEAILGAKADIEASGLLAAVVGHVGDGNFHCIILVPPEPDGIERAWALDKRIVARALALGGSCSGEHGVGIGKREFLAAEHGEDTLDVMRTLKTALDPRGVLNPGKIFLN